MSKVVFRASPLMMNAPSNDETSFIKDLRKVAMKLHTPAEMKKPMSNQSPDSRRMKATRQQVMQFLMDSLKVYETMEFIVSRGLIPDDVNKNLFKFWSEKNSI